MTDDTKDKPPSDEPSKDAAPDDLPPNVVKLFSMPTKRPDIKAKRKANGKGRRTINKATRPKTKNPLEGKGRAQIKRTVKESVLDSMQRKVDAINKHLSETQRLAAKALSPPQIKFANNILNGLSNGPAWADAFPEAAASMNMREAGVAGAGLKQKREVQVYLEAFKSAAAVSAQYDRKWKRDTLVEIVERSMALSPVLAKGQQLDKLVEEAKAAGVAITLETKFNAKGAISGLHELNMMDGDLWDGKPQAPGVSHEDRLRSMIEHEAAEASKRNVDPAVPPPSAPPPPASAGDQVH